MSTIDIGTKVAGVSFRSCLYNASGPRCTTKEELVGLGESHSGAIMMKSCTIEPREGNPKPRYACFEHCSIQSMGLPNLGYEEYLKFVDELAEFNKPAVASIAGLSLNDYVTMTKAFQDSNVSLIELNLSCPNIEGKPQVAYDIEQTEATLSAVAELGSIPLGLKLPPFYDRSFHESMAELVLKYNIRFLSCINSIGNTLIIDADKGTPALRAKHGYGGLSGPCIKPIALANVRIFHELLGDNVSIVGVGGVQTGTDVYEYLLAGASAVQIGTMYEEEGVGCFERIENELGTILKEKGYTRATDAVGALKEQ